MQRSVLIKLFLRSLTIQASLNFARMQALGFAYAMLPLLHSLWGEDRARLAEALTRHLEPFNTHPYLTAAILGTVAKIEEEGDPAGADHLKKALMGPYAAIGDVFFWGTLRTFCGVTAVLLALAGIAAAPFAVLALYDPAHLWVRLKGFSEGYRRGRDGVGFIGRLDLPGTAKRIRILTVIVVGVLAAVAVDAAGITMGRQMGLAGKVAMLLLPLLFFLGVRRGFSQVGILYGTALLCMVIPF